MGNAENNGEKKIVLKYILIHNHTQHEQKKCSGFVDELILGQKYKKFNVYCPKNVYSVLLFSTPSVIRIFD